MKLFIAAGLVWMSGTLRAESPALFTLNEGRLDSASGEFTRAGTDTWQGVVASFAPVALAEVGDSVEVTFQWQGGSSANNSPQRIAFGLFHGEPVNGNGQTQVTDSWTGMFHAIGSRSAGNGGVGLGMYRQSRGAETLFDRRGDWAGGMRDQARVGDAGTVLNRGHRPGIDPGREIRVRILAIRESPSEIKFVTEFDTNRPEGGDSGQSDHFSWEASARDGKGLISSTHRIADGAPVTFSGLGLVGADHTFVVRDLRVNREGSDAPAVSGLRSAAPAAPATSGPALAFREERMRAAYNALAVEIEVERRGEGRGRASAAVRTRDGSARANTDYVPAETVLHWDEGDSEPQLLRITPLDNPSARGKFFTVELHAPGEGAELGSPRQIRVEFE
ncbi:MAG: hypothetical protein JJU05_10670 [Verrucomicrobia bacterium]|nr:hypothetical protein [Verrucomicrobiota bacterium]MCH8528686.1 hypothetical protein [Kiritimatiellia bacterium]